MQYCDLHIHTTFSDGTLGPDEVVKRAKEQGLSTIAITDHDSVDGIDIALEIGRDFGITVIPGVELSCKKQGKSVHMLGYFVNYKDNKFLDFLENMQVSRVGRAKRMLEKLNDLGMRITMEELKERVGSGAICRPHIATLLAEKGFVNNSQEAFNRYIGDRKPCYVAKASVTPSECIEVIKSAGGIPVIAHPGNFVQKEWIYDLIKDGIMGIETFYPTHRDSQIDEFKEIAQKNGLLITGGSDSHGELEGHPKIGEVKIPYASVENFLKRRV